MTKTQHNKIKQITLISCTKIISALEWLILHNPLYAYHCKNYDINSIPTPVIIDCSLTEDIESLNTNIELKKELCVVFPDSNLNECTDGFQSINEFKNIYLN